MATTTTTTTAVAPAASSSPSLVRCADGSLVAPGQPCPEKRSWMPWIVGAVAVVAGVGAAYWIARQKGLVAREAAEPTRVLRWLPGRQGVVAHSEVGTYRITGQDEGGGPYELHLGSTSLGNHRKYKDAKDAAKADYDRRTR